MSIFRKMFGREPAAIVRRVLVTRTPAEQAHAELVRDMALAGVTAEHPVWLAVLSLVDEHAQGELEAALKPNLTDEQRQYAAGAAATADYLAQMLRDARCLAAQRMAKQKQAE